MGYSSKYHFNQLGSVASLTNGIGTVFERYDYDVYGKPTVYSLIGSEWHTRTR